MPAEKNPVLRIVVPVVVSAIAVLVVIAGYRNSASQPGAPGTPGAPQPAESAPATSAPTVPPDSPTAPTSGTEPVPSAVDEAAGARTDPAPAIGAPPSPGAPVNPPSVTAPLRLSARVQPVAAVLGEIGDLTPGGKWKSRITFTQLGAGVDTIAMADFFETISKQNHYDVQQRVRVTYPNGTVEALTSLAARGIIIDGVFVDLFGTAAEPVWRETAAGAFEAEIIDETGTPVVRIERRYEPRPNSFRIDIIQRIENLAGRPVKIEWVQYGPIELHEDISGYGLDMRRVRLGYLLDPKSDPSRQIVRADSELAGRTTIIDAVGNNGDSHIWPKPATYRGASDLVWIAQTSRYFVFGIYPLVDDRLAAANVAGTSASPIDKGLRLASEVHAVVRGFGATSDLKLLLQLTSAPIDVAAGGSADLSFGAYAGPLGRKQLVTGGDPVFEALGLSELVIYNLGGMCAFCTFQWLAKGLLLFLTLLHDYIVFDWAIAIMILVVCVRSVLHPVTRRSQIGLMRFSKQMQSLAPKQQKLREKFKDDPKRMQQEMITLMREERVNYAGALGCLPMFLQMPIWIALYAMLYFSFDLRHSAAYYGVFQAITGGGWSFLGDLSVADHFIYFGGPIATIPLFGSITGINILPVFMGVLFWFQQKYMTPPSSSALTPEQEMQQKMMKTMTVFLFPLLMYNAPSGLAIYFITNSALGILESRWIRAHVNKLDLEPPKPKEPRPAWGSKRVENTAERKRFKDR